MKQRDTAGRNVPADGDRSRAMSPVRDRSRVEPIRLGPGRNPAVSLDTGGPAGLSIDVTQAEADLAAVADWRAVIRGAKLSPFECRVFIAHWRHGVPLYKLSLALDCKPAEAAKAYRAVVEKLHIGSPAVGAAISLEPVRHSLRLASRERLHTGARPWSLSGLDADFASIMTEEKFIRLISQRDPTVFEKRRTFCPLSIMADTDNELATALTREKKRLDELIADQFGTRRTIGELSDKLNAAEAAVRVEDELGLLERRDSSPKLRDQLASLQTKLQAASSRLATLARVIERQRKEVARVESEIDGRLLGQCEAEMPALREELHAALRAAADVIKRVHERRAKYVAVKAADLFSFFPSPYPSDRLARLQDRFLAEEVCALLYGVAYGRGNFKESILDLYR